MRILASSDNLSVVNDGLLMVTHNLECVQMSQYEELMLRLFDSKYETHIENALKMMIEQCRRGAVGEGVRLAGAGKRVRKLMEQEKKVKLF